jgi:hypothetical protein
VRQDADCPWEGQGQLWSGLASISRAPNLIDSTQVARLLAPYRHPASVKMIHARCSRACTRDMDMLRRRASPGRRRRPGPGRRQENSPSLYRVRCYSIPTPISFKQEVVSPRSTSMCMRAISMCESVLPMTLPLEPEDVLGS